MTEERACHYAEALALSMGITFYVVRCGDRFLPVQLPSDDCIIFAKFEPPGGAPDQPFA